jgi:hypothetical protein
MPFKNKEKAKEYFDNYNQKRNEKTKKALREMEAKERKCDLDNFKYATVLITSEGNEMHLCPNHLIALATRSLEKHEVLKLRELYGDDYWIYDMFYSDDGEAIQPVC